MAVKKISTAHKGRRCKAPDCKRPLSIYNLNEQCYIHMNKIPLKNRLKDSEA